MRKLFALLMLVCLGISVVACGPTGGDAPTPNGEGTESTENGDHATDDTGEPFAGDAAKAGTDEAGAAVDDTAAGTDPNTSDDTVEAPLEAPPEDINLSLDGPQTE